MSVRCTAYFHVILAVTQLLLLFVPNKQEEVFHFYSCLRISPGFIMPVKWIQLVNKVLFGKIISVHFLQLLAADDREQRWVRWVGLIEVHGSCSSSSVMSNCTAHLVSPLISQKNPCNEEVILKCSASGIGLQHWRTPVCLCGMQQRACAAWVWAMQICLLMTRWNPNAPGMQQNRI